MRLLMAVVRISIAHTRPRLDQLRTDRHDR